MWSELFPTPALAAALAEIPISADQVQLLIYAIIGAVIVGGLGSIKATLDIVRFFRGDPPSSERYASKADLADVHKKIGEAEARAAKDLHDLKESTSEIFREIRTMSRSLGRIEGRVAND